MIYPYDNHIRNRSINYSFEYLYFDPDQTPDIFRCESTGTIPKKKVCDGRMDCVDYSDEKDCGMYMAGAGPYHHK